MIDVFINGQNESTQKMSILEYLEKKNIKKDKVVVEINGKIIKKDDLSNYILNNKDKIEIIRFIGGG